MPSATATPQPRGIFEIPMINLFNSRNRNGNRRKFNCEESGQVSPESKLRAAPPVKVSSLQKSPPLLSCSLSLSKRGLHGLFAGFRTIHPNVVFFCHTFCIRQKRRLHGDLSRFKAGPPPPCCTCARKKTTLSYYT